MTNGNLYTQYSRNRLTLTGVREKVNVLIICYKSLISWTERDVVSRIGEKAVGQIFPETLPAILCYPPRHSWVEGWPGNVDIFLMCGVLFPWREDFFVTRCIRQCSDYIWSHRDMNRLLEELLIINIGFTFLALCHQIFFSCIWKRRHQLWRLADTLMKRTVVVSWLLFISVSMNSLNQTSQTHTGGEIHILLSTRENP